MHIRMTREVATKYYVSGQPYQEAWDPCFVWLYYFSAVVSEDIQESKMIDSFPGVSIFFRSKAEVVFCIRL